MTINGNFWTTHAEWMAHVGPRHLVQGQEHGLEAGRCDEDAAKLERQGWRCGFTPAKRNALKAKTDSSVATSAGTFVAAPKHWGPEWVWPARGWQAMSFGNKGGSPWHGFLSCEESQSSAFTSTTPRSGRSATSRYWRRRAEKFGGAEGCGFWRRPETFRQYATPSRLPGVSGQASSTHLQAWSGSPML